MCYAPRLRVLKNQHTHIQSKQLNTHARRRRCGYVEKKVNKLFIITSRARNVLLPKVWPASSSIVCGFKSTTTTTFLRYGRLAKRANATNNARLGQPVHADLKTSFFFKY